MMSTDDPIGDAVRRRISDSQAAQEQREYHDRVRKFLEDKRLRALALSREAARNHNQADFDRDMAAFNQFIAWAKKHRVKLSHGYKVDGYATYAIRWNKEYGPMPEDSPRGWQIERLVSLDYLLLTRTGKFIVFRNDEEKVLGIEEWDLGETQAAIRIMYDYMAGIVYRSGKPWP